MRNFQDYKVWHLGMQIVVEVYQVTKVLPDTEKYGLQSQMRRSAVSIPSNIAEGCSRQSDKAFAHFLEIAIGSSFELQTQCIVTSKIGYLKEDEVAGLLKQLDTFQRKTNALLTKIR